MPILGIVASATSANLSDYQLIQTINGDNSSRYLSFDAIPDTFKHLAIRGVMRNGNPSNTGLTNNASIYFNDEGSSYTQHQAYTVNNSVGVGGNGYAGTAAMLNFTSGGAPAGAVGYVLGTINDYRSSKPKVTNIRTGSFTDSASDQFYILRSQMWNGSAAITKITFGLQLNEWWTTHTAISLYGIKG